MQFRFRPGMNGVAGTAARKPSGRFRAWAASPSIAGLVLLAASLAGLVLANSSLAVGYFAILHHHAGPAFGSLNFNLSVEHWINDGLMSLFFLAVTLEIKREVTVGHLDSVGHAALPALGALGGMIGPALIYAAFAWHDPEALPGWAVPVATDAAFTLPLIAALGSRIPPGVRAFLMALAIFDDVLAILIIALFYSAGIAWPALACAGLALAVLVGLNKAGVRRLGPYLVTGVVLWTAMLQSGVHATLAAVLLGLCIPSGRDDKARQEARQGMLPVQRLEHAIQPCVALLILPLFGLANVGTRFDGLGWSMLAAPVGLGIAAGLFLGKQLGVFGFVVIAIRLRLARKPEGATYAMLYGVALLCGIGFTISLFIAALAFSRPELLAQAKIGIFAGSILSAGGGWLWLRFTGKPR